MMTQRLRCRTDPEDPPKPMLDVIFGFGKNRAFVPAIASEFCPALRLGIAGCRFTCAQAWHCRGHDRVRRRRQRGRRIRPKRQIEPPLLPRRHPDERDPAGLCRRAARALARQDLRDLASQGSERCTKPTEVVMTAVSRRMVYTPRSAKPRGRLLCDPGDREVASSGGCSYRAFNWDR